MRGRPSSLSGRGRSFPSVSKDAGPDLRAQTRGPRAHAQNRGAKPSIGPGRRVCAEEP